jgi:hypothetical protein
MTTQTKPLGDDRFVTDVEAAALLSLSRGYLRQLRVRGGGAPYSMLGRAVRYSRPALLDWANSKSINSTSEHVSVH